MLATTITHVIETGNVADSDNIPLPNISNETLEKVVEFLRKHGYQEIEKE